MAVTNFGCGQTTGRSAEGTQCRGIARRVRGEELCRPSYASPRKRNATDKVDALVLQLLNMTMTASQREVADTTGLVLSSPYLKEDAEEAWPKQLFATLARCLPQNKSLVYGGLFFHRSASTKPSLTDWSAATASISSCSFGREVSRSVRNDDAVSAILQAVIRAC